MTFAPRTLRDLAAYWVSQGGVNLGIVGDTGHQLVGTSYHLGADQLDDGAYSATLPRDKAGLSNAASAIDLGRLDGTLANLQGFSRFLVSYCMAGAEGSRDIREIIYTPNGRLPIHRWSALDRRVYTGIGSGDNSHLTHTHISYWRDSEFRDKREPFRAYFNLPDTSTGGSTDMGLRTENPRSGAWDLEVVATYPVSAIVIHDGTRIGVARGTRKRASCLVYVPVQPGIGQGGQGDAYILADENPAQPDPAAVLFARDVHPVPVQSGEDAAYNSGLDAATAAVQAIPRR